ncbi:MAG TPA: hypothetical protein VHO06_15860 [Polyangia bacterium]|nr:hypothetical protein [Polyangia bacterium]
MMDGLGAAETADVASNRRRMTTDHPPRYARVAKPGDWLEAASSEVVTAIVDSISDHRDRLILAWPARPDNGFVAASIALRELRAKRSSSGVTLGLWPWRSGATHAARSILVHPDDILRAARADLRNANSLLAPQRALALVEIRLKDLFRSTPSAAERSGGDGASGPERRDVTIKNPTLLETTIVFPPVTNDSLPPFASDADQILKRVRRHTTLGWFGDHVAKLGDPLTSPFAVFGLPPSPPSELSRFLRYPRLRSLDCIVLDLTRLSQDATGPDWPERLGELLQALSDCSEQAIPLAVLCEDGFSFRKAESILRARSHTAEARPQPPIRCGAPLMRAGLLRDRDEPPLPEYPDITFDADIKDASLAPLRDRLLACLRQLREVSNQRAARALSKGLRGLSRLANLPIGLAEAQQVAAILFPGDDSADIERRSIFYPTASVQPLADAESLSGDLSSDIREVITTVKHHLEDWRTDRKPSTRGVMRTGRGRGSAEAGGEGCHGLPMISFQLGCLPDDVGGQRKRARS